ncbi:MAG: DUF3570 domain-containing protein [Gammaproteobacteria bacterium]
MARKLNQFIKNLRWSSLWIIIATALIISLPLTAAILPEDRADALFHSYDGGGAQINGPSLMARKQIGQHFSFWTNYYVDSITSATIDVETFASPYTEERTQYTFAGDYLNQNTTMSFSFTNSEESDYSADTYSFGISHNMFGDLTTVSLGFTRGDDNVRRNSYCGKTALYVDPCSSTPAGSTDHWRYRLDLSQIITKNMIVNLGYEAITDEGYLNNPYRSVAIANPDNPEAPDDVRRVIFKLEDGHYPGTRTSSALAVRGKYYLPWRAALKGEYRTFGDSWGTTSNMYEVEFTQPIKKNWNFDFHYRSYSQSQASFYSNLFLNEKIFMARDKELSAMSTTTLGGAVSYKFLKKGWWIFDNGSAHLSYDRIQLDYQNFLDESVVKTAENPSPTVAEWRSAKPYSFTADVIQFYISVWY